MHKLTRRPIGPGYLCQVTNSHHPTRSFARASTSFAMSKRTDERKFPLKQPPGYKAPVVRWTLKLSEEISHIYTLYLGIQSHNSHAAHTEKARRAIQAWLNEPSNGPVAVDRFIVTDGFDVPESKVWVAYWTDLSAFRAKVSELDIHKIWQAQGKDKHSIGIWSEQFATPIERLETNYSRLDHKPGIAQVPGSEQPSHDLSAYWGAGRDRIPESANDLFEPPPEEEIISKPNPTPRGLGEHLTGTNYDNMCHIRSGQWWEACPDDEREAYEGDLQKTLMSGMNYLWEHPEETGTIGLRFLQNVDSQDRPIKETCGAGFHRNWRDLEKWSSTHPSHLKIFRGALKHAKKFGEDRKFMTWHEVSILKSGEAQFQYVNCMPETGVIRWVKLDRSEL